MKKLSFLCMLGLLFILTACKTTKENFDSSVVQFEKDIITDDVKADLIINDTQKISGESVATYFLFFKIEGDDTYADGIKYNTNSKFSLSSIGVLNKVKSAAAYKALNSDGGYDVLLHPKYSVTVKKYPFVKVYKARVSGYGAKYKNFRTIK